MPAVTPHNLPQFERQMLLLWDKYFPEAIGEVQCHPTSGKRLLCGYYCAYQVSYGKSEMSDMEAGIDAFVAKLIPVLSKSIPSVRSIL